MEEPTHITAERIVRELTGAALKNDNSTRVHINAEGFGAWLAGTAAALMLGMNVFLAALVIDHSRKLDNLHDYLSAIYMQAPHLKPKDAAE
jgi:hypothetical protein